ncbi:MAG: DUF5685 family protein [Oscillospiraceae bacterium]
MRPFKPEMKVKEFDTFKGIYCGLCKNLSKTYSVFSSLTLSYDFTFLATVYLAIAKDCKGFKKCCCTVNPLLKKACLVPCDELTYCSSCAMLMIYYKVLDDIKDSKFFAKFKSIFVLPFAYFAMRKSKKLYPALNDIIKECIKEQAIVEKSELVSLDRVAHPSATALCKIVEGFSDDEEQKSVLSRFGYLVGRYVYFSDALDDLENDIKKSEFNPFYLKYKELPIQEIKNKAESLIKGTIAEIELSYEALKINRFKEILDNIIYLGLLNSLNDLMAKERKKIEYEW